MLIIDVLTFHSSKARYPAIQEIIIFLVATLGGVNAVLSALVVLPVEKPMKQGFLLIKIHLLQPVIRNI